MTCSWTACPPRQSSGTGQLDDRYRKRERPVAGQSFAGFWHVALAPELPAPVNANSNQKVFRPIPRGRTGGTSPVLVTQNTGADGSMRYLIGICEPSAYLLTEIHLTFPAR
jgi:hypothetical protein